MQYKVHVQINVYTNVPHMVHVLFILSKNRKDILRTFEADISKIIKNAQLQLINLTFLKKGSVLECIFLMVFKANLKK